MTGRVGRNDPCPCGSGKKYKKCCYDSDIARESGIVPPPKELSKRKFKVVGKKPEEEVFNGTMEKKEELDAESLQKAMDRESQELLTDPAKIDYRLVPSIPPVKRPFGKEHENPLGDARHDTE